MTLWPRLLILIASLYGAAGVTLAAVAAHAVSDPSLVSAANFLLFHAAALVGLAALVARIGRGRGAILAASTVIALGTALFCGTIAARIFLDMKLFTGSAPTGGTLLIAGWLMVGIFSLIARDRG
ncbi:DUF423 domain-containing protein [Xanthobacteraceae bacterium A53D]